MDYTITPNNIHLIESYKVSKKDFQKELNQIHILHPDCEVWNRSNCSLKLEWACHNFLYALHYKRAQTGDADLDYPQTLWTRIKNSVVGVIGWIFIK